MKLKTILIVLISWLILLFSGCEKPTVKPTINPLADIPTASTKRIEFSNMTVTSAEKELGRSKMVTDPQDIQNISNYLKALSCTESVEKERESDFYIFFIDNTDKAKNYTYSIGVNKDKIYVYKYNGDETNRFTYKCTNTKIVDELNKLYGSMSYTEELLMKK